MIYRDRRNAPGNRFQRSLLDAVSVDIRKTAWPMQTELCESLRVDCHSFSCMLPPLLLGKTRCLAGKFFLESLMFDRVDMVDVTMKPPSPTSSV